MASFYWENGIIYTLCTSEQSGWFEVLFDQRRIDFPTPARMIWLAINFEAQPHNMGYISLLRILKHPSNTILYWPPYWMVAQSDSHKFPGRQTCLLQLSSQQNYTIDFHIIHYPSNASIFILFSASAPYLVASPL